MQYVLTRTGKPPVRFDGELIAESEGRLVGSRDQTRYHDLRVYRTAAGRWVGQVEYHTRWEGEQGRTTVYVCDTPSSLAESLTDHPLPEAVGYPEGEAYAEKQRRLLADLRARLDAQISEVLDDDVFAEQV